jgi:CheY-like chemotaxis protein
VAAPAPANERRLANLRLLVVDDSDINREVAQRLFVDEGAEVQLAENGLEAVDWLRAHPDAVDLVLMDLQMPILDGRAATRMIRETPEIAGLPILALTADALQDQESAALETGMDGFLTKPFDVPVAIALIRALARRTVKTEAREAVPTHETGVAGQGAPAGGEPHGLFPGIAVDDWLSQWKDPELYRRYLRRFAHTYANSVQEIAAAEPEQTRRLVHKLKGTAATLGLVEIAARAADWERQFVRGLGAPLAPLQAALDTALASIARYAPEETRAAPEAPTHAAATLPRDQIAVLLRTVLDACDRFAAPAARPAVERLAAVLPAVQIEPLRRAIDDFDVSAAAAQVRALAASLDIGLED